MTERRFDVLLTLVLLAGGVWYVLRMLLYPANAGLVPAIVALVMVATLLVQLALMARAGRRDRSDEVPDRRSAGASAPPGGGAGGAEERLANEPEPDSYGTLIALGGVRRKRLAIVAAFSVLFYGGAVLIGFVVTTTVLLPLILVLSKERVWVALLGGVLGAVGSYALVVLLLGLPALSGTLFR